MTSTVRWSPPVRRSNGRSGAKNFQLDIFDPSDGHYEYSAVVTNKSLSGSALWSFMSGRGVHEKVYGELKGDSISLKTEHRLNQVRARGASGVCR